MSRQRAWLAALLCVVAGEVRALRAEPSVLPPAPVPVRASTGAGVASTSLQEVTGFVSSGRTRNRSLAALIRQSGWTPLELRSQLSKTYQVDTAGLARFLNSEGGVLFLHNQTRSYVPFAALSAYRVQALRAAILADSEDGEISALGIMQQLPTDFRLARLGRFDGVQNVCAELRCEGRDQCSSLLSWYVFLPACLQANATTSAVDEIDFSQLESGPRRRGAPQPQPYPLPVQPAP